MTTSPWPDEPLNDPLDDLDYLRSQRLIPAYGVGDEGDHYILWSTSQDD